MGEVLLLHDYRTPEDSFVDFSQCSTCYTFFDHTELIECPVCFKAYSFLASVDEELRIKFS